MIIKQISAKPALFLVEQKGDVTLMAITEKLVQIHYRRTDTLPFFITDFFAPKSVTAGELVSAYLFGDPGFCHFDMEGEKLSRAFLREYPYGEEVSDAGERTISFEELETYVER